MLNVSDLLDDSDFAQTVKVSRYFHGFVREGLRAGEVASGKVDRVVVASVQPIKPSELQALPEGYRTQKLVKLYTQTRVFCEDGDVIEDETARDIVDIKGEPFVVKLVEDWSDYGYWKAFAVLDPRASELNRD